MMEVQCNIGSSSMSAMKAQRLHVVYENCSSHAKVAQTTGVMHTLNCKGTDPGLQKKQSRSRVG